MKATAVLLAVLLSALLVSAQTVNKTVTFGVYANADGAPLARAGVKILEFKTVTPPPIDQLYCETNSTGLCDLELPDGVYKVVIFRPADQPMYEFSTTANVKVKSDRVFSVSIQKDTTGE